MSGSDLLCWWVGLYWCSAELYRDLPARQRHLDPGPGPACHPTEPPGLLSLLSISGHAGMLIVPGSQLPGHSLCSWWDSGRLREHPGVLPTSSGRHLESPHHSASQGGAQGRLPRRHCDGGDTILSINWEGRKYKLVHYTSVKTE